MADTIEVLESPAVSDVLGSHALALAGMLADSFVPPRRGGELIVPDRELQTENLAVHPVLATELRMPVWGGLAWLRPADRELLARQRPDVYAEWADAESLELKPASRWQSLRHPDGIMPHVPIAFDVVGEDGDDPLVLTDRTMMLMRTPMVGLCGALTRAAVIAHEADHAWRVREQLSGPDYATYQRRRDPFEWGRMRVGLEIPAYGITYAVTSAQKPDWPSVSAVAAGYRHMSAQEAGERAGARRHGPNLRDLHALAVTALALSQVFGDGSPQATDDEVTAYRAAGLIAH